MIRRFLSKYMNEGPKFIVENNIQTMENPIITVKQGKLKGAKNNLLDGTPYYSFKGIPYAQPPVGKLRFKAPLPPKPWQGVYEALKHQSICPQYDMTTHAILDGDESSLFLNVYTPTLDQKSNLPVMVFIHGGAFMSGSGNSFMYGPKYLLKHDVILVTFNYRLEALGFLCLDTPEVPGNAGMKDQVACLEWVKNNVREFGGDPNNVTVFGESAGGASVTYHLLSPMTEGLFSKAISQSGCFLNDWAFGRDGCERAFRLGKLLGKETNNADELLDFLQSVPVKDLVKVTARTLSEDEKHRGLQIHFGPVVEKKFNGVKSFLDREPLELLMKGQCKEVPLVIGHNSAEGIGLLVVHRKKKIIDNLNKNPSFLVPREIAIRCKDKLEEFGKRIKHFYVGDGEFTIENVKAIADRESDVNFVYGCHRFVNLLSNFNKSIYFYEFSCDTELNAAKIASGVSHMKGACHADDLFYIFSCPLVENNYKENKELQDLVFGVTKMWTNFAKTGNPTPDQSVVKWLPYTNKNKEYLNIDKQCSMESNGNKESVDFWNSLYKESGLPCITKSNL